jgi:DNA-directed RNA polymerase subunit RPC12/RpoP
MSRESLGYTQLEWDCPRCGSRNPGPQKTCLNCGAPQPADIQFHQADHQELIKDPEAIEKAKAGADIHCAFCGARNPAGATTCMQCGADLKEGTRRESGRVVGAFTTAAVAQIPCPNCGTPNPETALKCTHCGATLKATSQKATLPTGSGVKKSNFRVYGLVGLVSLLVLCGVIYFVLAGRTQGIQGSVQSVAWITSITIEGLQPATHQAWRDEIPGEATIGSCSAKIHHVQDQPAENANKVCGTPYSVDQGSGYAEVVQDCQYEVYQDYCDYTVMEWNQVDVVSLQGSDYSPVWPQPQLLDNQRLGEQEQTYSVVFDTSKGQYTYQTSDFDLYQQCQLDSQWTLNINSFDKVVSIEASD